MKRSGQKTIGVCAVKIPFLSGGAEILSRTLVEQLQQAGFRADLFEIPFGLWPPEKTVANALAWRMLELTDPDGKPIDLIITTKFPSYLIKHPNKVAWLFHQMREIYDPDPVEEKYMKESILHSEIRNKLIELDIKALKEHRSIFTISDNVGRRLSRSTGIRSETIYPPPRHSGKYYNGGYGDYILSIGRLDPWKRTDLLIEALKIAKTDPKAVIVGSGSEEQNLKEMVSRGGLQERVKFLNRIDDETLLDLYANCRAVFFCPRDEDFGFITIEAFLSGKLVITANDSGGPTEFVKNGKNGFVIAPSPEAAASAIDALFRDDKKAAALGRQAQKSLKPFSWENVIEKLVIPFL